LKAWCRGTELNRRRQPFQGCALPPELPRHAGNWVSLDLCAAFAARFNGWQTVLRNILGWNRFSVKKLESQAASQFDGSAALRRHLAG
jgi:hypothetical protein